MSLRGLGGKLRKAYPKLRGAREGSLRRYANGTVVNPNNLVLRGVAEVLGVRADWLMFDQGGMTGEPAEPPRVLQHGGPEGERAWGAGDFFRVVRTEFGSNRVEENPVARRVLLEAWGRLLEAPLWPRWHVKATGDDGETLRGGIDAATSESPSTIEVPSDVSTHNRIPYAIAVVVGRALGAPFKYMPVEPDDLSDQQLLDYVITACQALHRLADARSRRGRKPPSATAGLDPDSPLD